jgi:serine/threonine-protein kinase
MLAGRYRLVSAGVMEDVYVVHEAHDTVENRPVTVLALSPGLLPGSEALRRLIDLQVTVADLSQPGLVPYEHAGIVTGRPYLVRPSLSQRSLAQIMARGVPLAAATAIEISLRLCETLAPLHKAGLVHGSLSPYSVLASEGTPPGARAPEWAVSVVDIGLLPALYSRDVPGRRAWGRSPYFSPEQAAGSDAHPSSDVYVVASLLYTMLAGRPPFRGTDPTLIALQHERQEPPSLEILLPGISPRLAEFVEKALEKEPANRYRHAGQMAHVLRGLWAETLPGSTVLARPTGREQLVVPAPPAELEENVNLGGPAFQALEQQREQQPALANCLTVLLLILALVAVLGLIPLWRTLYRLYATPPTPSLEGWWAPDEPRASQRMCVTSDGPSVWDGWTRAWGVGVATAMQPADPPLAPGSPGNGRRPGYAAQRAVLCSRLEPRTFFCYNWLVSGVRRVLWSQAYGFFRQPGLS